MENYSKGEVKELEDPMVFTLSTNDINMRVAAGSKIRNLMGFAMNKIKEPGTRKICWSGSGKAITKTVTCVEIMKRRNKGLHQITKIRSKRIEEYWEPKLEGLERLKVNRDIPAISILLSKDPLNQDEPGYQAPGSFDEFWSTVIKNDKSRRRARTPFGSNENNDRKRKNPRKKNFNDKHNKQSENDNDKGSEGKSDSKAMKEAVNESSSNSNKEKTRNTSTKNEKSNTTG
ncbi:Solute carrier 2 [Mactra antiquata]